jgi:hypothetical protein
MFIYESGGWVAGISECFVVMFLEEIMINVYEIPLLNFQLIRPAPASEDMHHFSSQHQQHWYASASAHTFIHSAVC